MGWVPAPRHCAAGPISRILGKSCPPFSFRTSSKSVGKFRNSLRAFKRHWWWPVYGIKGRPNSYEQTLPRGGDMGCYCLFVTEYALPEHEPAYQRASVK